MAVVRAVADAVDAGVVLLQNRFSLSPTESKIQKGNGTSPLPFFIGVAYGRVSDFQNWHDDKLMAHVCRFFRIPEREDARSVRTGTTGGRNI